jgi:hypothetical protein
LTGGAAALTYFFRRVALAVRGWGLGFATIAKHLSNRFLPLFAIGADNPLAAETCVLVVESNLLGLTAFGRLQFMAGRCSRPSIISSTSADENWPIRWDRCCMTIGER